MGLASTEDRPYWNMAIEPLLNTPAMARMQFERLKQLLARLQTRSEFHGRRLKASGLIPEKLTGFDEFKDRVPVLSRCDLMAFVAECGGDLLLALDRIMPIAVDDLDYIATTTGTTGMPTPYPLTKADIGDIWGEVISRAYWRAGVRQHDRILFCFALSMVLAGIPTMMGMNKLGATILPVGAEAKTERILLIQKLYRGTVYAGTPSLAEYLIGQCPKVLGREVNHLGFKALFCGGEPGAGVPEIRKRLESAYEAKVFDAGAGFGCSCDHPEYQGLHWLGDDLCYYELVDPETKAPIVMEDGAIGEAVFTMLIGEGCVHVRQGFGDVHQVFTSPCPCGRSGFRYKIIGRLDDMLKVKGVMIYPSHILAVVGEFWPRITGALRIVLDERPPKVSPPLKIKLEYASDFPADSLPMLEKEIVEVFSRRLKVSPQIMWQMAGSLERSQYKGQVFERNYLDKGGAAESP